MTYRILPRLVATCFLLLLIAVRASAVTNGSFELGAAGWSLAGDGSLQSNILGFTPTDGTNMALLTTIVAASEPFAPVSGIDATTAAAMEATLTLPPGTIQSPTSAAGREGSMVWQTFTAASASILAIDWNLLSMEPNAVPSDDDFVFIHLSGVSNTSPGSVLTMTFNPTASPAIDATGWVTSQFPILAGVYTVGIGVFDAGDDGNPSAMLLDNVRLIPNPEPNTASMVALGLAGLAFYGRRRS
jgi:hypothetical protein